MAQRLKGKTALITGGAAGLGRAMAFRFAREGARVVVCDVQDERLESVVAGIEAEGGVALGLRADIGVERDVQGLVRVTVERFGGLDVLVNNASVIGQVAPVSELDLVAWETALRINLTGAVLCSREAIRAMTPRRSGSILNISSNVGRRGFPNRAPYVCSKWALIGLTQTLALETAQHGIRVNAICPGPVRTERLDRAIGELASLRSVTPESIRDEWASESPMGRFVTEDECTELALFLVSDASSGMTGQSINVNAG
jgi:NAD(P)-dependent dehydrogenase (short-subunit alcohol dehydrogenase family)